MYRNEKSQKNKSKNKTVLTAFSYSLQRLFNHHVCEVAYRDDITRIIFFKKLFAVIIIFQYIQVNIVKIFKGLHSTSFSQRLIESI